MAYKVVITERAIRDLEQAANWYMRVSPEIAGRWRQNVLDHITLLENYPLLCPVAHEESRLSGRPLRSLLHGKRHGQYRILFEVKGACHLSVLLFPCHTRGSGYPVKGASAPERCFYPCCRK